MRQWFRDLFNKRRTEPPRHAGTSVFMTGRSETGVAVTPTTVHYNSTAFACGSLIARTIASLPAHVLAPRADGDGNEPMPTHPAERLLGIEANAEMTGLALREAMVMSAVFRGAGYAEIQRDDIGRPVALWPIEFDRVTPCRRVDDGTLVYEVSNNAGGKVELDPENTFVLLGPSLDGVNGLSLIAYAKQAIGLGLGQDSFAANFLRNQAAPSGLITVKNGPLTAEGLARLRAEVDQLHTGVRKAGKVLIGDSDMEWTQIGVSPQDAEFLEQRRFTVEEICRFFGVPPQLIGDTSKQTFANYEQAGLNFLGLCILPWVRRFESEASRKLFSRVRTGRSQPFLKLNIAGIARASLEAQSRSFALGRQWGWYSVNDVRKLLDLEPIGPDGDIYLQPTKMPPATDTPPGEGEEDKQRARALRVIR